MRQRLDQSEERRDEVQTRLTALLTDMRPEAAQKASRVRWGYVLALMFALAATAALAVVYLNPELLPAIR